MRMPWEGGPLPGGYVNAEEWLFEQQQFALSLRAFADAGGNFTLNNVPREGRVSIDFAVRSENGRRDRSYLGMSARELSPRDEPYTVVMFRPIQFRGTVVDDETGAPVREFTVKNGWRSRPEDPMGWISMSSPTRVDSAEGEFIKMLDGVQIDYPPTHEFAVGIMAEGYIPATSPVVRIGQPVEPFVLRLRKGAPIQGTVLDAAGAPVAGARVAWKAQGERCYIEHGVLDGRFAEPSDYEVTASPEGQFTLPPSDTPGLLLAMHGTGYAIVPSADFAAAATLTLKPWAKVTGVVYEGDVPAASRIVSLVSPEPENAPVQWNIQDSTDANGRFELDFVPAQPFDLGKFVTSRYRADLSHVQRVAPQAGETLEVRIGTASLHAFGRIDFTGSVALNTGWDPKHVRLAAQSAGVAASAEGGKGLFMGSAAEDGAFQFDNLEAGDYEVSIELEDVAGPRKGDFVPILGSAAFEFSLDASHAAEGLDLGTIALIPAG
ncbi:MAG: carboxypeptidase regulatory-like domain-containing protein [Candidatus Hydrogenedentes bacterium]|nr:carboxypeptidase regulatory-like domain-containing protein [Candidatus Hydrogenedentota bacterium]